ncbi:MAG: WYL domain-containing protein [Polaromonas sp.]|nr:WYL domain-containing protein [Polaromonas sp.]
MQRDLLSLATSYDMACDDREKPFGWTWLANAVRPVLAEMDVAQALAFNLLLRECKDLMPPSVVDALQPWFDKAQSKLKQEGHAKASRWPQKIAIRPQGPPLLAAKTLRSTMDTVSDALFSERQIKADYRSAQSLGYRPVRLHPLGLVRTGLITYLVATFGDFSDPRLLALHRLKSVKLLDQETVTPRGFDLNEYLVQDRLNFGSGKQIQLSLRMFTAAAAHLQDTPLSKDQTIQPDKDDRRKVLVSATVGESPRLVWWLLGFGKQVEVLEPESVRRSIDNTCRY